MTDHMEEGNEGHRSTAEQALDARQKLLFGMFAWALLYWGRASEFKAHGYHRKYAEARQALYIGLSIYAVALVLFVVVVQLMNSGHIAL